MQHMKDNETLNRLAADLSPMKTTSLAAEVLAEFERAGTDGFWCFGCGQSGVLTASCDCPHPENFNCVGHKFCGDCVAARRQVAVYLKSLFATKISTRVNSQRSRSSRFLTDAAETEGLQRGVALQTCLYRYADPHEDSPEEFKLNVLRAFRKSQLFDFRRLAHGIEETERDFLVWKIARSGILGRRAPRPVLSGIDPDEEFYS